MENTFADDCRGASCAVESTSARKRKTVNYTERSAADPKRPARDKGNTVRRVDDHVGVGQDVRYGSHKVPPLTIIRETATLLCRLTEQKIQCSRCQQIGVRRSGRKFHR